MLKEHETLIHLLEGNECPETHEELADAFGSLSIGEQGQAKFHGQSAGSDVRYC